MKRLIFMGMVACLLLPWPGFSQETGSISGEASVTGRVVSGERESAKFEEYREIPEGAAGDVALKYTTGNAYFLDLKAKGIAQDDQFLGLQLGRYGRYKVELIYDQIPHRFAYDARTLYYGVGTGNLVISNALRTNLQSSSSTTDVAVRLKDFFQSASAVDLELMRKTLKANVDLLVLNPLNFRLELSRENRTGSRPFSGTFGFGNSINLPEPIDYDTTQMRLSTEYNRSALHLSAAYYLSLFENHIGTLRFDNPFRVTDSTASNAYTFSFQGGPARGLIDLYPNNTYHNISLTGAYKQLPFKSTVSLTASWGWMRQDDRLVPYTTNTAMRTGAVTGLSGILVPFNAFDPASLPTDRVDGKVNTSLYNLVLTSKPLDFMRLTARYRYYDYDNKTGLINFPGHNRMDAVWEPEHENNVPTSYTKQTAGANLSFDVLRATRLTLGYTYDRTDRTHREAADQEDNIYKVSLDTRPLSWLDLRTSYERSDRKVQYDFRIPFVATHITEPDEEGGAATGPLPQIPSLRKYDQADRTRDRIQFLATVNPFEPLTLSGSVSYGKDDFKNSDFGLNDDTYNAFSLEADYSFLERVNLFAFYSYETYDTKGRARQWTPGSRGDPFGAEPGVFSFSNWDFKGEDKVHTFRGGFNLAILPKKMDFTVAYTLAKSDGKMSFSSPLGTTANDNNPYNPLSFNEVDESTLQNLNGAVRYRITPALSVSLGYMWEKLKVDDLTLQGFTNVPVTSTGAYQAALLMGPLVKGYDVNIVYSKLTYAF